MQLAEEALVSVERLALLLLFSIQLLHRLLLRSEELAVVKERRGGGGGGGGRGGSSNGGCRGRWLKVRWSGLWLGGEGRRGRMWVRVGGGILGRLGEDVWGWLHSRMCRGRAG